LTAVRIQYRRLFIGDRQFLIFNYEARSHPRIA